MSAPLDGVRVLDLSAGRAGGTASMVLADFGADVITVEPPGGDPARAEAAWPMWLRGKRSVTLDLATPEGRARMHALAREADVALVSDAPGEAGTAGADAATLRALNPNLIYCSITGWGPRGPYAGYPASDGLVAARSGRMLAFAGQREREGPAYAAVPVASHAAAQGAVQGIVAALLARMRGAGGAVVETSLLQALMPYELRQMILLQLVERDPATYEPLLAFRPGMPTLNYHPVMTRDGRWMQMGNLLEHLFISFLQAADLTDLLIDERFQGPPPTWDPADLEEARDRILTRMQERTVEEWMTIFHANGNVAAEPFLTAQEALDHADMLANGDVVDLPHPRLGVVRQPGPIATLTETPGTPGGPAPEPGADAAAAFGPAAADLVAPGGASPPPPGRPLDGVTILEFATIIATPLGTSILADLGARVIKVEPIGGDPYRAMGGAGIMAAKTNAGKESIAIDLKSETGQAIVGDLIRRADAIVHNYRPGVPERLGIGYERARELRPDIVWVSANGYGPDCASANRPSAHPVPGAVCGGALHQAGAATPPSHCGSIDEVREVARQLMRANEANPDPNTSVVIASATLLALFARERYGVGQRVFVNMLVANAYANGDDFLRYEGKPPRATVDGELYGTQALQRLYPARSGWVFVDATDDDAWGRVCGLLGRLELADDPRFTTAAARADNEAALVDVLAAAFAERDAADWEAAGAAAGVGCVQADAAEAGAFWATDPHVQANGFAPQAEHAALGRVRRWGPLSTVNGGADRYGPGVLGGQHTDAILRELGHDAEAIRGLRAAGVVWSEEAVRPESPAAG